MLRLPDALRAEPKTFLERVGGFKSQFVWAQSAPLQGDLKGLSFAHLVALSVFACFGSVYA
jgi:hypothetical protein